GPTVLVVENGPGMLTLAGGAAVKELRSSLEDIGYTTATWDLNAANFGVPQTRRRIFVVAADGPTLPDPPDPKDGPRVTVWDAIGDLPETPRSRFAPTNSV